MEITRIEILEILSSGQKAPSADNCQPWFFTLEKNAIFLHHDKENTHANHLYNIDYFADYVSLGGVLENMHIHAHHLGYTPEISLLGGEGPLAKIELKKTHAPYSSKLLDAIPARKTNRKNYLPKKIPGSIKQDLLNIAEEKKLKIYWIDNPGDIKKFAKIISIHDYVLWEDKALRENLVRMLRFGKKNHEDGLSLDSLELGFKKHFFSLSIHMAKKIKPLRKALGLGSVMHHGNLIKKSAAIAFLVSDGPHHQHTYVEGGRALQSIWLHLTKNDIHLHPLFGTLSLMLNKRLSRGGISEKHSKIQMKIVDFFHASFPELKNETPIALFRVGYAKSPSAVSGRREIEKMLKKI